MGSDKETRILDGATAVFLRYGYRKTTMGDLAQAAGMSRPALYLLYCNKERIFEAVLQRFADQILETIQRELKTAASPLERLHVAFEHWVVRPFELMAGSQDTQDLIQCGFEFAEATVMRGYEAFEALLRDILTELPGPPPAGAPNPAEVARVLAVSARGFKSAARNVDELRGMIDSLLRMSLASLQPRD